MDINFVDADTKEFDPQLYIKILVAIAKADRYNGPPEIRFVKKQADRLGLEFEQFWRSTDRDFSIERLRISRLTALVILKDSITLASLDGSYSLAEKEKIYTYAEKLDIPRADVDYLEKWLGACDLLHEKWKKFVALDD